jgi:U6 snRNA-associated Sm-like protein LSm2
VSVADVHAPLLPPPPALRPALSPLFPPPLLPRQLFYSAFKTMVGKEVTVELKNDLAVTGVLHSVDQYLNIKLAGIRVADPARHPHMASVRNCFIRGSVVRYVVVRQEG